MIKKCFSIIKVEENIQKKIIKKVNVLKVINCEKIIYLFI